MEPSASDNRPRFDYIDGLRGWAILLVVLVHVASGLAAVYALARYMPDLEPDIALPGWLRLVCDDAAYGVDLFFLVSAASLTLSNHNRNDFDWRAYVLKRFLRIAPMFYVGALFYLLLYGFGPRKWAPNGISWGDILVTFAFVHVWLQNSFNSVVPGGWSIGDEVMFYLLLPLLLWAIRRSMPIFLAAAMAIFIFVQYRYLSLMIAGRWSHFQYFGFLNQLPVFLMGTACGALMLVGKPDALPSGAARALSYALFAIMILALPQMHIYRFIQPHLLFSLCGAVFIWLLSLSPGVLFTNRIIRSLGKVSFSLYLVHFAMLGPAYEITSQLMANRGVAFLAAFYLVVLLPSYLVAATTYRYIELPFIEIAHGRLKLRAGERQSGAPSAAIKSSNLTA